MRAVRVAEFGVDHIRVDNLPDPEPASGEVLISTQAATVNPADFGIVTGAAAGRFPPGAAAPYTPGWDLVGRVVGCGQYTDAALMGSRVVGFSIWFVTGHGTQASLVTLPATDVAVAPDDLPAAQLTTVGLNGLTAWRGLADLNLTEGETLVITGASGGVGGFATELAAARGVTVIAVVRRNARDTAAELGASAVLSADDGELGGAVGQITSGGADALLDTASIGAPALAAVRDGGRYVSVTDVPDAERDIAVSRSFGRMDADGLATLVEMASTGRLHTPVSRVFAADEARHAYEHFSSSRGRGRTVLSFAS